MDDEVTSDGVRVHQFDVVRKGYDRKQVESFLAAVARRIEQLERSAAEDANSEISLGLDEPEALARELNAIGGDVATILEAARATADSMRSRAVADVEEWRSTAEAEASHTLADATEQSHSLRSAAWNEGSSMLQSALAETNQLLDGAKEEALFIRAEAEREAIRLTGDAKRDREEMIRTTRLEADQIIENARTESDGVLAAANQAAELAQERARALEERRSELLTELEAARSSIGQLETQIESKRQQLDEPVAPLVMGDEPRMHHTSDGGSVRIVSPSKVVPLKPVDADSFVAEIEALRRGNVDPDLEEPPARQVETVAVIAPLPPADTEPEPVAAIHPESAPESPEPEQQTSHGTLDTTDDVASPTREARQPTDEAQQTSSDGETTTDESEADEIGSLFARLRDDTAERTDGSSPFPGDGRGASATMQVGDEPPSGPEVAEAAAVTDDQSGVSLIPVQNAALRTIKRSLVDLQNDALEHLRTEEAWLPKKGFTDRFHEAFAQLATTLTGSDDDRGASAEFAADLSEAVTSAIVGTRDAGSGDRAVAAAASKVFRTWRSDEAERRVVAVASALADESVPV
ncbi:MAG: hypothetical protein BMS9Abin20_0651 [Acidimicrobiia bacterium]|nr:MAG: hypothetical protein BMS9Abin20_0651 [Acidimicrobiia bacterium]